MGKLWFVGAGSFAKEIYGFGIRNFYKNDGSFCDLDFGGFLISKHAVTEPHGSALNINEFEPKEDDRLIMAAANPCSKKILFEAIQKKGIADRFISLWHKSAINNHVLSYGMIVMPGAVLSNYNLIEKFCTIGINSTVGHDVLLGGFCTLSSHVDICGEAVIGQNTFIGSNASILPKVRVKPDSYIGAGSIVTKDCEGKVFGNPARAF